jgi:hypothetical protein
VRVRVVQTWCEWHNRCYSLGAGALVAVSLRAVARLVRSWVGPRRRQARPARQHRNGDGAWQSAAEKCKIVALKIWTWVTLSPWSASLTGTSLLTTTSLLPSMASVVRRPLTSKDTIASESPWTTRVGMVILGVRSAAATPGISAAKIGSSHSTAVGSLRSSGSNPEPGPRCHRWCRSRRSAHLCGGRLGAVDVVAVVGVSAVNEVCRHGQAVPAGRSSCRR